MKKSITTLLFLSFFHFSFGQNIEWSDNRKFSDMGSLAYSNSRGEYIVAGNAVFDYYAPPSFFVLDSLGNLITKQFFEGIYFEVGSLEDVLELPSGDHLVLGKGGLCDVCCWSAVQRYDQFWNPLWNAAEIVELNGTAERMDIDDDGIVYFLYGNNKIVLLDSETREILEEIQLDDKEYNDILIHDFFSEIVVGEGIHSIYDSSLSFLEDYYFTRVESLTDTSIITLNDTNIYIIDQFAQISNSLNFANQKIEDISINELYISLLIRANNDLSITIYDYDLNEIQSFSIEENDNSIKAITLNNDQIMVAGIENSENKSMFGKTYSLDGLTNNFETDIGISDIEFETMPIATENMWSSGYTVNIPSTEFTVYNYGNSVIESLRINADFGVFAGFCEFRQTYSQVFEGLQLNPGESITLTNEEIQFYTFTLDQPYEFCFWTSIPNNKIDRDHSNDNYCESIIINNTDEVLSENDFQIFPNPAQSELKIELPEDANPELIQIFDVNGKLVFEVKNPNGKPIVLLNIDNLLSGVYFIEIQESGRIYSSRFLKM